MKNRWIKSIPNACSMGNAFCGLLAILMTTFHKGEDPINLACIFIMFGGFLDSIDGFLARKLNASTPIGKQLDSFADLMTFGIAPVTVFLSMHMLIVQSRIHILEICIAAFYVLCAIYRLARYNVSDYTDYFEGLPTTASGVFMCLYIFLSNMFVSTWKYNDYYTGVSCVLILLLGLMMVSKIRVNRVA